MGSGTTAIAAIRENRHFVGFELDETYYIRAMKRIGDELGDRC
jgi:site-specific DNA-methyltransferase (adenine-specific)